MSKTVRFFGHCIGTNTAGRNMHKSTSIPRKYENCSASSHDHPCKALSTPYKQVETTSNTNLCLVFQAVTNAKTCTENGACAHEQWTSARTMQHRNTTRTLQNLVWMSTHKETQASAGKGDKVCKTANMSKREQKSVRKNNYLKTWANKRKQVPHMHAHASMTRSWPPFFLRVFGCLMNFNSVLCNVQRTVPFGFAKVFKGPQLTWLQNGFFDCTFSSTTVTRASESKGQELLPMSILCQRTGSGKRPKPGGHARKEKHHHKLINRTQLEGAHCY